MEALLPCHSKPGTTAMFSVAHLQEPTVPTEPVCRRDTRPALVAQVVLVQILLWLVATVAMAVLMRPGQVAAAADLPDLMAGRAATALMVSAYLSVDSPISIRAVLP